MRFHVSFALLLSSSLLWNLVSGDDNAGEGRYLRSTKRWIPDLVERQCQACPGENTYCCDGETCYWTEWGNWGCGTIETVTRTITFITQETTTVSVTVNRTVRTIMATGSTSTRTLTITATPTSIASRAITTTIRKRADNHPLKKRTVFSTTTETVIFTSFRSPAVTETATVINSASVTLTTNPVVTITHSAIAGSSITTYINSSNETAGSQTSQQPTPASRELGGLTVGAIVGIVIGTLIFLFALIALAFFIIRRRGRSEREIEIPSEKNPVVDDPSQPTLHGGHGTPLPYNNSSSTIPALLSTLFSFSKRPATTAPNPIPSSEGLLDAAVSHPPLSGASTPGSYLTPNSAYASRHKRKSTLESVPEFIPLSTGGSTNVSRPTSGVAGEIFSPVSPLTPMNPVRLVTPEPVTPPGSASGMAPGLGQGQAFRIPRKPVPVRS
ncbi:hypothetical protein RUND412_007560 [Rhizina undulata]